MIDKYIYKNHKKLRYGYTTGTCAAAAAKAAAHMLLTGCPSAAINSTPRAMIKKEVLAEITAARYDGGMEVVISAPADYKVHKQAPFHFSFGGLSMIIIGWRLKSVNVQFFYSRNSIMHNFSK